MIKAAFRRNRISGWIWIGPILLAAVFGGCRRTGTPPAPVRLRARTTRVKMARFYRTFGGYGQVLPVRSTLLTAHFSGRIHLHLAGGSFYRRGEVIYELGGPEVERERRTLWAGLETARARLQLSRAALRRRRRLKQEQFVSTEEWNRLQTDVRTDSAALEQARSRCRYFEAMVRFRAPYAGILQDLQVNEGDYVAAGQMIGRFWERGRLKLAGTFYGETGLLKDLFQKEIRVILGGRTAVRGRLTYLEAAPDPGTGGQDFWIELRSRPASLRPGRFVRFRLEYGPFRAPAVPDSALILEKGRCYLVVRGRNGWTNQPVRAGVRQGGLRQLIKGPPPGTEIACSNVFELFYRNLGRHFRAED